MELAALENVETKVRKRHQDYCGGDIASTNLISVIGTESSNTLSLEHGENRVHRDRRVGCSNVFDDLRGEVASRADVVAGALVLCGFRRVAKAGAHNRSRLLLQDDLNKSGNLAVDEVRALQEISINVRVDLRERKTRETQ